MLERLGYLMEIMSIILCVHILYGKKFRLNIKNIVVLSVSVILVQAVNTGVLSKEYVYFVYVFVFFYCYVEFGYDKKKIFINNALNVVILSCTQMLAWVLLVMLELETISSNSKLFLLNFMVLLIVVFVFPYCKLNILSQYMQQKHMLIHIALVACLGFVVYILFLVKVTERLLPQNYIVVTVSTILIVFLVYQWQQNRFQVREQAMELKMYQMYNETFQTLLAEIRGKQHDFENHINAIYCQHYTANTLEELVEKQKQYCENVLESNKYHKLLKLGDSTIAGFLYGKFLQAEQKEIKVKYKVNIEKFNSNIPTYKFVEVVGNLFDNAIEAVLSNGCKKEILIELTEVEKEIIFTISNPSQYISQKQMNEMFQSGKSSKGENRGLGLANVAKICNEYQCNLYVENKMKEENYIEFKIHIKNVI